MRYTREKIKELTGIEIEEDFGYIEVMTEKQFKSRQQSNTFHALLGCFWKSGCSSFETYDDMRDHYKKIAHLLEIEFENTLPQNIKAMLWRAIKILPIPDKYMNEIYELLNGRTKTWHSWSECSKEMASVAIDQIISDMWKARVDDSPMANKFKEILNGFRNQIR